MVEGLENPGVTMKRPPFHFLLLGGALIALLVSISLPGKSGRSGCAEEEPRLQYSSYSDDASVFTTAFGCSSRRVQDAVAHLALAPRKEEIRAGIVSHHLLVKDLIAEYFEVLTTTVKPRTIVILGPNHHARGSALIAVSSLPWKTPFGVVDADTQIVARLMASHLVEENDDAFFHEHSIGALVPFIRHSFPAARIVPIIFRRDADSATCSRLGEWLAQNTDHRTFLLGSMDFSHYKTSADAEEEDRRSLPVLVACNPSRVREAYVDSHPALMALLTACREEGAVRAYVLQHTNSGILLHQPQKPCTSYIDMVFAQSTR